MRFLFRLHSLKFWHTYLPFCALVLLSTSLGGEKVISWQSKLIPNTPQEVLITVDTTKFPNKTYLSFARCEVGFHDSDGKALGTQVFDFPTPQLFGKIVKKAFKHKFESADLAKGVNMYYQIRRVGHTAIKENDEVVDEGRVPPDE